MKILRDAIHALERQNVASQFTELAGFGIRTLRRDFGHDPDELREQVVRTVRHELAHHVGFDELGVSRLDL